MKQLHAPLAWVEGRWQRDVLLTVENGHWTAIVPGQLAPPDAELLAGPLIPSLVNAHSHAFQRAFVGLAERREAGQDDFWSWRDRMYALALRISPQQLRAVAAQLYAELLRGGYTQVCEFHYLHHPAQGEAFDDDLDMAWALASAAEEAGIGLTLMPVVYTRSGFGAQGLRPDQHRFAADADWAWRACQRIQAAGLPRVTAGVALHSLRGASPADIARLRQLVGSDDLPIHIHVAEQTAEVADCLAATGRRPIQWLAEEGLLDARWQLVHATHATAAEIEAVAASGAGIVICPGTEANLGDGLADLPRWLHHGVPLTVGSDSQVTRGWVEELRWLEYGQRLVLRQRNVAADPGTQPSSAARLFDAGGGRRRPRGRPRALGPGARRAGRCAGAEPRGRRLARPARRGAAGRRRLRQQRLAVAIRVGGRPGAALAGAAAGGRGVRRRHARAVGYRLTPRAQPQDRARSVAAFRLG